MKRLTDQHATLRTKLGYRGVKFDGEPTKGFRSLSSSGTDKHGRKFTVSTHWDGGSDVYDRLPGHLKEETKKGPIHVLPMAARVGPSRGHEAAVDYMRGRARAAGHSHAILLGSKANPIPAEHKRRIFQRTFGGSVHIMHNMVDHIKGLAEKHKEVHIYASDDDEAPGKASRHAEYKRMFKEHPNVHVHPITRVADESGNAFRGRHMRAAAENGDFYNYARQFAKRADRQTVRDTYKAVRKGMIKEASERPGESLNDHHMWMAKVKNKYSGQLKSIGQPKPRANGGFESHIELWHGEKLKAVSTGSGNVVIPHSEHFLTPKRGIMGRNTRTFAEGKWDYPSYMRRDKNDEYLNLNSNRRADRKAFRKKVKEKAHKERMNIKEGEVVRPNFGGKPSSGSSGGGETADLGKVRQHRAYVAKLTSGEHKTGTWTAKKHGSEGGNPFTIMNDPNGNLRKVTTDGKTHNVTSLQEGDVVNFPKNPAHAAAKAAGRKSFKTRAMNTMGWLDKEQGDRVRDSYVGGLAKSQIATANPDLPPSGITQHVARNKPKWNRAETPSSHRRPNRLDEVGDTPRGRRGIGAYVHYANKGAADASYTAGQHAQSGDVKHEYASIKRAKRKMVGVKRGVDRLSGEKVYEARRSSTGNDASDDPKHIILDLRKAKMNRAGGHPVTWADGKTSKVHPGHIDRALAFHDEFKKPGYGRHVVSWFTKNLGGSESDFYDMLSNAEEYARKHRDPKHSGHK